MSTTATASTSTPISLPDSTPSSTVSKPKDPELLPLEEDDEFEEFTEDDWGTEQELGSKAKNVDSLWEDNWDDDDIEDDFSTQLRAELAKQDQMQT